MFDFDNFETVLTSEFRNFATQIARGSLENYFDDDFDQVAGYKGWLLVLLLKEDAGGAYIVPTFYRPLSSYYKILNVRILINPVNHLNPENERFKYADRFNFKMEYCIKGKKMYLSELLDEKNGWLNVRHVSEHFTNSEFLGHLGSSEIKMWAILF
ncbi:hypothetical protein CAEBREN_24271 [Caenorhabditis brenneri]|uniref:MATH domain-containing protein n=1 Tax=Caenorhabditis brenneri TaxID=135651 RepID=G0P3F5_CAEBE|nr:hypothetical protein CAEBREN_24271 [Caenorhabditis brenneri]